MPPNMGTRVQTRQAFSVVNGGQDLPPTSAPPSHSGSDDPPVEYTKETIESLLNEKRPKKNQNPTVCTGEF